MIPDSPSRSVLSVVSQASGALAVVALVVMQAAHAEVAQSGVQGSSFLHPIQRIGGLVVLLIVVAVLVWRMIVMIRRAPTGEISQRRRRDESIDRSTLRGVTDWGHDENKRAAESRSPVTGHGKNADLPSLEHAVTQWYIDDVGNANNAGVQPQDAMGQLPAQATGPYRTGFNPYFRRQKSAAPVEVTEVADTLMQAELLVQLGDPKQAMTLLSHHIRETEQPGPAAWLMLLNLYQSTGREAQYNALATGFRMLFNAEVPPWATSPDLLARDIETYPQVMMKLQTTWDGPQARLTVDSFLNDDRGGSRQGFSLTAYRELLFLSEILDMIATIAGEERDRLAIQRKLGTMPA
jgi:hypothetical protein